MGLQKGEINCIDPFNAAGDEGSKDMYEKTKGVKSLLEQFQDNLSLIPSSITINTLQGYSNEFIGSIEAIDFLFIDGDHSIEGCKFDFEGYEKFIKPGGFIAFHDYHPKRKDLGPTWVIENLVKQNNCYSLHDIYDSLCVFRKY
jgi:MMP 1-O-methyltransferase